MDLNSLLKDLLKARLAWPTIVREKQEALLTALVADVEALKAASAADDYEAEILSGRIPQIPAAWVDKVAAEAVANVAKRKPGRPAKVEEAA